MIKSLVTSWADSVSFETSEIDIHPYKQPDSSYGCL